MAQAAFVNNNGKVVSFDDLDQAIAADTLGMIRNNEVYKKVISDSFGGVMYNVANKYDSKEILALWNSLTPAERESQDGIIKGAMNFLEEYK